MFFDDITTNFKKQVEDLKYKKWSICIINEDWKELTNDTIINYIIDYIELWEQEKFEVVKNYINKRKEKMQEDKEKIDCKKYYCSFWNYYELLLVIYNKYKLSKNKTKFKNNLWNFIDKQLIKYIHINNQYLVVEQFYKIYNNQKDIDYSILENWANSILSKMWWAWNNKYLYDYIWQTIVELKYKIHLENWQNNYKSIFSYIYSYFKLSIAKVMRLDKVVDIPLDVLSCQYSNNQNTDTKVEKSKQKRLKSIYNKQTNSFNISSLDKTDCFIDYWAWINTTEMEAKYYVDFFNKHYKEQKYWIILEKYYIEWLWLKQIWKILWISAERVRQKKNKAINILKNLEKKIK